MIEPRLFICNGAQIEEGDPTREGRRVINLDTQGIDSNVNINFENVAKVLGKNLPARMIDLLEIAAYVYAADCSTIRGNDWTDGDSTEAWSRDFKFVVAVRDLKFWSSADVNNMLCQLLGFLSDDRFSFCFRHLKSDRPVQEYLEFGNSEDWEFYGIDRVIMFSGGLDSLAGSVLSASKGEKLMLVSHSPVSTMISRQRKLFNCLRGSFKVPMIHVPVWINKDEALGREHTQRTRSFLFSALGALIAESIKAGGVRFFENGVVSLNLPVADEVLRARASRTTHPFTLQKFSEFYRLVVNRDFVIDNPFVFMTKAETISLLAEHGAGELIQHTCSCAHVGRFQSSTQWHCGTCSQCIDRRIAILQAGLSIYDP